MALKNIFDIIRADRYTADGREEINKAQEADVEDRRYNIGEISEKTGLQKTANGWVKPKNGKQPGAKKEERPSHEQAYLDAFKDEKLKSDVKAAIKKYGATGNNLRNALYKNDKELSDKLEKMQPDFANQFIAEMQRESKPTDETDSAGNKRPSTDVAYLKGSKDPQLKADVKKAIATHHATGNNLLNVLYNKDKELYKKLDAMGTTNAEQFINQLAHDSAPRVLTGDCRIRVRKA